MKGNTFLKEELDFVPGSQEVVVAYELTIWTVSIEHVELEGKKVEANLPRKGTHIALRILFIHCNVCAV